MNRKQFLEHQDENVLVCDGAMGTRLYDAGIDFDQCFDALSVDQPELVNKVHREYLGTGVHVIETNSFGANGIRLRQWGREDEAFEFAKAAAHLASEAVD